MAERVKVRAAAAQEKPQNTPLTPCTRTHPSFFTLYIAIFDMI